MNKQTSVGRHLDAKLDQRGIRRMTAWAGIGWLVVLIGLAGLMMMMGG